MRGLQDARIHDHYDSLGLSLTSGSPLPRQTSTKPGESSVCGSWLCMYRNSASSVIKHFSFFRFLNPENPGKQQKTWKQRDLGTYVPFGENLTDLDTTKTYETYGSSSKLCYRLLWL